MRLPWKLTLSEQQDRKESETETKKKLKTKPPQTGKMITILRLTQSYHRRRAGKIYQAAILLSY